MLCRRNAQCGILNAEQVNGCFSEYLRFCEYTYARPLRAGAVTLTDEAVSCIREVNSSTCEQIVTGRAACDGPFVAPATALSATCNSRSCAEGFCSLSAQGAGCGTCEPFYALGAACSVGAGQCDPDAGTCVTFALQSATCRAWLADGESCIGNDATLCRSRLCPPRPDGGAVCGPLNAGESCSDTFNCGPSQFCSGLVQRTLPQREGRCAARIAPGSPCQDQETDDGCAGEDAACLDGLCVIAGPGSRLEGQSCDQAVQCGEGLFCSGFTSSLRSGVCATRLSEGAPCVARVPPECALGLVCAANVCLPYASVNEPCVTTSQCKRFANCLVTEADGGQTCVPYATPGEVCRTKDCLGGHCPPPLADGGRPACVAFKADDEACTGSAQCESQRCFGTAGNQSCFAGCFAAP